MFRFLRMIAKRWFVICIALCFCLALQKKKEFVQYDSNITSYFYSESAKNYYQLVKRWFADEVESYLDQKLQEKKKNQYASINDSKGQMHTVSDSNRAQAVESIYVNPSDYLVTDDTVLDPIVNHFFNVKEVLSQAYLMNEDIEITSELIKMVDNLTSHISFLNPMELQKLNFFNTLSFTTNKNEIKDTEATSLYDEDDVLSQFISTKVNQIIE